MASVCTVGHVPVGPLQCTSLALSFKWRNRRISKKQSRFMMLEKVVIANSHFVDHASSICGSTTKPIVMTRARNFFISARVCAVFSHNQTLEKRVSSVVLMYC